MTPPASHTTNAASYDIIIAGGGLAGLVCAIELSRAGYSVALFEKKQYPFHKVCGEYISNEVLGYLRFLGFDPHRHGATSISKLRISTPRGKNIHAPLSLGGFGISRYLLDDELHKLAISNGAQVFTGHKVTNIEFRSGTFHVLTSDGAYTSQIVIGAWGKRDVLDKKLDRSFIKSHTGYMGVKYHIHTEYPADEIGLDNFPGGYCGISKVEGEKFNLCYLYQRGFGGNFKTVQELEHTLLFRNPVLKNIFTSSDFLFTHPEVINEISFAPKQQVEDHILMCGDTAGLITPLCGNGMSMAISAAQLLSRMIIKSELRPAKNLSDSARQRLESEYCHQWKSLFSRRLYWGRLLQRCFGVPVVSELALAFPPHHTTTRTLAD